MHPQLSCVTASLVAPTHWHFLAMITCPLSLPLQRQQHSQARKYHQWHCICRHREGGAWMASAARGRGLVWAQIVHPAVMLAQDLSGHHSLFSVHVFPQVFREPLNASFLHGLLSRTFSRGSTAQLRHLGKQPIKVGKRPIKEGKRPLRLMGCFRVSHRAGKQPL